MTTTLAVVTVVLGQSVPHRHADGAGVLASLDDSGSEKMAVDRVPGVSAWSFGMRLCITTSSGAALITSIGPTVSVGTGYRFVGAAARTFKPTPSHEGIISTDGYPPPASVVPDALQNAIGYRVTTPCNNDPTSLYTELIVGLAVTSGAGGGWRGVDVTYTYNGSTYVLAIEFAILICGDAVQADCAVPG
ncbi:MAG TPA: hypothetical protein VFB69_02780 [Candidatus Dormibacteraeota bacterium]|nr:hypothetical protein [Candidatus Dormibacteraeota bacterium]